MSLIQIIIGEHSIQTKINAPQVSKRTPFINTRIYQTSSTSKCLLQLWFMPSQANPRSRQYLIQRHIGRVLTSRRSEKMRNGEPESARLESSNWQRCFVHKVGIKSEGRLRRVFSEQPILPVESNDVLLWNRRQGELAQCFNNG